MNTPIIGTSLNIAYSTNNGTTWKFFGLAKNAKMKESAKTIEISSPTTGDYTDSIPGRKSWTMSCSCLLGTDVREIESLFRNGTKFLVALRDTKDETANENRGTCFIKSINKTADIHQMAKMDIEFQGCGKLEYRPTKDKITFYLSSLSINGNEFDVDVSASEVDNSYPYYLYYINSEGEFEHRLSVDKDGEVFESATFDTAYAGKTFDGECAFYVTSDNPDALLNVDTSALQS